MAVASTGMRRGAALGPRWEDVDLDRARISIRQNMVSSSYKVTIGKPKSGKARSLSIDPGNRVSFEGSPKPATPRTDALATSWLQGQRVRLSPRGRATVSSGLYKPILQASDRSLKAAQNPPAKITRHTIQVRGHGLHQLPACGGYLDQQRNGLNWLCALRCCTALRHARDLCDAGAS